MIGVADRRDEWVGPSSRPERLRASLWLVWQNLQRERNGALFGVHGLVRPKKCLDRGRHCQRGDFTPQRSPQNRPFVDGSKPAIKPWLRTVIGSASHSSSFPRF